MTGYAIKRGLVKYFETGEVHLAISVQSRWPFGYLFWLVTTFTFCMLTFFQPQISRTWLLKLLWVSAHDKNSKGNLLHFVCLKPLTTRSADMNHDSCTAGPRAEKQRQHRHRQTHTHRQTHARAYTRTHTHTRTNIHTHIRTRALMHTHIHTRTPARSYTHTHIQTDTHTHVRRHAHVRRRISYSSHGHHCA